MSERLTYDPKVRLEPMMFCSAVKRSNNFATELKILKTTFLVSLFLSYSACTILHITLDKFFPIRYDRFAIFIRMLTSSVVLN